MPGKYDQKLLKTRSVLTVGALAIVLIVYGFRHLLGL